MISAWRRRVLLLNDLSHRERELAPATVTSDSELKVRKFYEREKEHTSGHRSCQVCAAELATEQLPFFFFFFFFLHKVPDVDLHCANTGNICLVSEGGVVYRQKKIWGGGGGSYTTPPCWCRRSRHWTGKKQPRTRNFASPDVSCKSPWKWKNGGVGPCCCDHSWQAKWRVQHERSLPSTQPVSVNTMMWRNFRSPADLPGAEEAYLACGICFFIVRCFGREFLPHHVEIANFRMSDLRHQGLENTSKEFE